MKLFGRKNQNEEVKKSPVASKPAAVSDTPKKETKPSDKKVAKVSDSEKNQTAAQAEQLAHRILLHPVVSEKAAIANSLNKYVFAVSARANKSEIKKAIKSVYGVMPQDVNIINRLGKKVVYRGKGGMTKDYKKAIITLKKGDSIKIYEGI